MVEWDTLWERHGDAVEDFWGRRQNQPRWSRDVRLFGRALRVTSNHEGVLEAVDACLPLYSMAPPVEGAAFSVQVAVRVGPAGLAPAPEDISDRILYTGEGDWLSVQLDAWGHCHVDLAAGRAVAVLSPQLASQPHLVARCLLNTVFTNLLIGRGYALLHASCLLRGEHAILMMAPHNVGKSTTALRLALSGHRLLTDSMVFLPPVDRLSGGGLLATRTSPSLTAATGGGHDRPQLLGFPVGRVKLRGDVVPLFPQFRGLLGSESVRGETKFSLDLRQVDPRLVEEHAACPAAVDVCLLRRGLGPATDVRPATSADMMAAVMACSLFYDSRAIWSNNIALIKALVGRARCWHLTIGSHGQGIVDAVASLGVHG